MKRPILLTIVLILLAAGAYAAYRFSQAQPDRVEQAAATLGLGQDTSQPSSLQASGIVEAHSVLVSSELGGRITSLDVAEGDSVVAGQPLLAVNDSLLQARAAQADAAIAEAEAQLALAASRRPRRGHRPSPSPTRPGRNRCGGRQTGLG